MLHSTNSPTFIVWLPAFTSQDIGQYVYYNCLLTKLCLIILKINLISLIKPFWYMTKKSRQKLQYLENEKSFWGEIKRIFYNFKGLSVAKSCLRPESAHLNLWSCRV